MKNISLLLDIPSSMKRFVFYWNYCIMYKIKYEYGTIKNESMVKMGKKNSLMVSCSAKWDDWTRMQPRIYDLTFSIFDSVLDANRGNGTKSEENDGPSSSRPRPSLIFSNDCFDF